MSTTKKAEVSGVMVIMIIIMATGVVFLFFIEKYTSWLSTATDEEICKDSVTVQGSARVRGIKFTSNELECHTQYTTVDSGNEREMKRAIAEKMARCWWMFGEGKNRIFEETDTNFCVVCYVLGFKEKRELKGIANFLATEKMPSNKFSPSKDITYQTYLTGYSTEGEALPLINEDVINTNEKQAVMFTYSKKIFWNKAIKGTEYGLAGAVGGAAVGAAAVILSPLTGGTSLIAAAAVLGTAGAVGGARFGVEMADADWAAGIVVIPYRNDAISSLGCEELP